MRVARSDFNEPHTTPTQTDADGIGRQRTRDCPRVTVRLSLEEHAKLQELADGASLSVFLRSCALDADLPRRRRATGSLEDQEAIAQLLGLLGASRIANNLNQLAHHANIGTLPVDERTTARIDEAYEAVIGMRQLLLKSLGYKT